MDLERAIEIAASAHRGQIDKAGQPYILHPLRVMLSCEGQATRIVAVLHDVIEDTDWTSDALRKKGASADILAALDAVTKRKGESYSEFIERAAQNPIGRDVKMADLRDNMDLSRIAEPSAADLARMDRYRSALRKLNSLS